jgi:4-hydroxybenzoate polyprenyltransferase
LLLRFPYHVSFLLVFLGILTVKRDITLHLLASAAALYFSFNILLYGGIYTLHAIWDARFDRLHPRKCLRPVASGVVPIRRAGVFGTVLLLSGLLTGYVMFPKQIIGIYAAVLLLNAFYSIVGRAVPYLEIIINAATYPLRYLMGAVLAGGSLEWPLLILVFIVAAGGATLRRRVELEGNGVAARPVLAAYSVSTLMLVEIALWLGIGVLRLADRVTSDLYYLAAAVAYAVLVLLPEILPPLRLRWRRFWSA